MAATPHAPAVAAKTAANLRRTPDGKPDFQGFYESDSGAANQGLEKRTRTGLTPAGRGIVVDPPDGILPMQPWATSGSEPAGTLLSAVTTIRLPTVSRYRSSAVDVYVPAAFDMIQTPDYLVVLHERMSWRIVRIDGRPHLPETMRLWQGDSVAHWEGDTLVVDTTNLNGKTWLNEGGEVVSYAEHVVERFTPGSPEVVNYEATVTDPVVYTRPWTIAFPMVRKQFDLGEAACHEEDHDLPHLKALKDAAAKKK